MNPKLGLLLLDSFALNAAGQHTTPQRPGKKGAGLFSDCQPLTHGWNDRKKRYLSPFQRTLIPAPTMQTAKKSPDPFLSSEAITSRLDRLPTAT